MASDGGDSTATKATGLEHAAARQPRTALLEPLDPAPAGAGAGAGAANTPSASSAAVAPYATPIGSDSGYHTDRSIIQGRGVSRPATPDDGGGNGSSQRQSPRTSSFGGAVAGAYAGDEHGEEVKLNMPMVRSGAAGLDLDVCHCVPDVLPTAALIFVVYGRVCVVLPVPATDICSRRPRHRRAA